jgi:cobalamin-dependent methionine synthase I
MIVIADNLNARHDAYVQSLAGRDRKALAGLAVELSEAGADMINLQCSADGAGDEELLPWAVEVVQEAVDVELSLDSRNMAALKKAITLCRRPPLINYLSQAEPEERDGFLALAARSGASLILLAAKGSPVMTFEAKIQIVEELMEDANAADIPNERLFADPGLVHIGRGAGQDHLVNSAEFIRALKEVVDPPINTVAWISNVSTGMPSALRSAVESSFLAYLAGAGLDAAMVDVLDPAIRKTVYLLKSFRDEVVFTPADIA